MCTKAEVISIHIVRKPKAVEEPCNCVTIRNNFGIDGDYRSGKYQDGQITLVEAEVMDEASRRLGYEIAGGASRRQIMVKGISLNRLVGYRLRLGAIVVKGEALCKPCNNMEQRIGAGAKRAMDGRGGIRCRVIKGGRLQVGDKVSIDDSSWFFERILLRFPQKWIFFVLRMFQS